MDTISDAGHKASRYYFGSNGGARHPLLFVLIPDNGRPGLCGTGQLSAVTLAVPPRSLAWWHRRLRTRGADISGSAWAFRREYLCFNDPDGLRLALIEEPDPAEGDRRNGTGQPDMSIRRIHSVEIEVAVLPGSAVLLADVLGFALTGHEGAVSRFESGVGDVGGGRNGRAVIDVVVAPGRKPGHPGAGVARHVAWRIRDATALATMVAGVVQAGFPTVKESDGAHFKMASFREPSGVTFALATDAPAFSALDGTQPR